MTALQIIPDRPWPLDAVTQKFAWLGRTGSGKSYACKRFVEQMLKAGAQVIVVDSVGVWFGLRQGHGFDIPVIGGLYGDIPLEPTAGALVAEVAVSSGSSLVLDVSQMNDHERARFMTALGQRLFELKKVSPGAMHLVLDEGQDAVPQNPLPHENMMLHEWVRICKQGRAFGMGVSIVSQRPQEISKKALNQVECVLAFQLTGAHERKALEYWLSDKGIDTKLAQTLPQLEVGVPYVWSPQWLKIAEVTRRVLPIESADTSQTPKVGVAPRERQDMKPIDLGALEQSMAEMVAKVAESDPSLLKKRIQELQAQLGRSAQAFDKKQGKALVDLARRFREDATADLHKAVGIVIGVEELLRDLHRVLDAAMPDAGLQLAIEEFLATEAVPVAARAARLATPRQQPAPREKRPRIAPEADSPVPAGEAAVLKGAFQHGERGVLLKTLAVMTDLAPSYVRKCAVSLSTQGLVTRGSGRLTITAAGRALVPKGVKPYPRGKKLIEYLVGTLPEGEGKILGLVASSKEPLTTSAIQKATGNAPSYVRKCLVSLSSRCVVTRRDGFVQIASEVFQ